MLLGPGTYPQSRYDIVIKPFQFVVAALEHT